MIARRFGAIALGGTGLLALASVSVNGGRTLRVVDMNVAPVRTVLAIYHHEESRPNPVHPAVVRLGTDVDRQAWQEMIARDLAREPLGGDVAKRLFASEVERVAREP